MSETDGTDNPAFTNEEDSVSESQYQVDQQRMNEHKTITDSGLPIENGHQRSFLSQSDGDTGKSNKNETRIELPTENNGKSLTEPKLNGVHGNGNNNDTSFLNNSATSVQVNDTGKKEQIEAVNLELVSMRPYTGNNLQTKGQEACEAPADPYEEYFVPVNEHRKYIRGPEVEVETTVAGVRFDLGPGVGREGLSLRDPAAGLVDYSHWLTALRGEKLYVTKDKRSGSSYWKRMACWGCGLLVLIVAVIIAILAATGVILTQEVTEPLDNTGQSSGRTLNNIQTAGIQGFMKNPPSSPPPETSSFSPWPTTDETLYAIVPNALNGLLKLDNFLWRDEYNDPKSRLYREVASGVERNLLKLLGPADGSSIVKVYNISESGDIQFRVSHPPQASAQEVQQMLENAIKNNENKIGEYHLRNVEMMRLIDQCEHDNMGCSDSCKYDYSSALFICTCQPNEILDESGKICVKNNGLSNVEIDDTSLETNTESVHDFVQGRSRGPGTIFEPHRPDNWPHLDTSIEEKEQEFDSEPHATPAATTEHNHQYPSDSIHWTHSDADHHSNHDDTYTVLDKPTSDKVAGNSKPEIFWSTESSADSEVPAEPEPITELNLSAEHDSMEDHGFPSFTESTSSTQPVLPAESEASAEPMPSAEPEAPLEPKESIKIQPPVDSHPSTEQSPSANPEPSAEPEPVAEAENSGQIEPLHEVESPAVPKPSAEPEPSAEPTAEPEPSAEPTAEPESSAEPAAEPEPSAEPAAEPEPSAEPAAEPEPSLESQPSAELEPSTKPQPTAEPEPSVESEPSAKVKQLPELQTSAEAEPSAEPEPSVEPKPEPSAEANSSAESQPSTESESSMEPILAAEVEQSAEPQSSTEHDSSTEVELSSVPPTFIATKPISASNVVAQQSTVTESELDSESSKNNKNESLTGRDLSDPQVFTVISNIPEEENIPDAITTSPPESINSGTTVETESSTESSSSLTSTMMSMVNQSEIGSTITVDSTPGSTIPITSTEQTSTENNNNFDLPLSVLPLATDEESSTELADPIVNTMNIDLTSDQMMTTAPNTFPDVIETTTQPDQGTTAFIMSINSKDAFEIGGVDDSKLEASTLPATISSESVSTMLEPGLEPGLEQGTALENTAIVDESTESISDASNSELSTSTPTLQPMLNERLVKGKEEGLLTTMEPNSAGTSSHTDSPLHKASEKETDEDHIMLIGKLEHTTAPSKDEVPPSAEDANAISFPASISNSGDLSHDHLENLSPENVADHLTEKPDSTYDSHMEDMSPFLPDVQKEKETVKKAPRLDKDEQDVPNPFEPHVVDVITHNPLNTINTAGENIGQKHLEIDEIMNDTKTGTEGRSHNYDSLQDSVDENGEVRNESTKQNEGVNAPLEEEREVLGVLPLEEQYKTMETTESHRDMLQKTNGSDETVQQGDPEAPTELSGITTTVPSDNEKGERTEKAVIDQISVTPEKAEENALEDQYNDITDESFGKIVSDQSALLLKKANAKDFGVAAGHGEDVVKTESPTRAMDVVLVSNGTDKDAIMSVTTMQTIPDGHPEDVEVTKEVPILPIEIQQDMYTTGTADKTDVTSVTEESVQIDGTMKTSIDYSKMDVDLSTVISPTSQVMPMEAKTTTQIPILPEELQTTENEVASTTLESDIHATTDVINSDGQVHNERQQIENRTDLPEMSTAENSETSTDINVPTDGTILSTNQPASNNDTETTTMDTNEKMNATEENGGTSMESNEPLERTNVDSTTQKITNIVSTERTATEDVRPVTEILENDTPQILFNYRSFFTTTPKEELMDTDLTELSEEDLRVIPLEKHLEVKKKTGDKKSADKYKYKKEKELSLDENQDENVVAESPESSDVIATESPKVSTKEAEEPRDSVTDTDDRVNTPRFTIADAKGNVVPIPKLKIVEITPTRNQSESTNVLNIHQGINKSDNAYEKSYPSFIPVSEEIIEPEPVTEPFILLRNYNPRRPAFLNDFDTGKSTLIPNQRKEISRPEENKEAYEVGSVHDGNLSVNGSIATEVLANRSLVNEAVVGTTPTSDHRESSDASVENTSHLSTSPPEFLPNVVFSKCTSGQFQCVNGTSRDGAYCVKLSAKCDSENDCSDGSDELNCEADGCPGNFQCASGQCLKRDLVCNKIVDCDDGSDEINCDQWKCMFDEFRCPSGRCIPGIWQCDGRPDCEDHRDEYTCAESCGNNEYLCPTEKWCIPLTWHCNGIAECANGEDEKLCDCALDQFKCQTGGCVPKEQVCDGIEHCPDNSDEWACLIEEGNSFERNITDTDTEKDADNENIGVHEHAERGSPLKIRQSSGEYRFVCSDGWNQEFSDSYCRALGFVGSEATESSVWDKRQKILRLKPNPNHQMPLVTNLEQAEICISEKVVQVTCQEFSCGSHYGEGPTARLVGGTPASEGQWSSVALLKESKHGAACTASILGPLHALASYSCIQRYKESSGWQLFTGENLLKPYPVKIILPYPQVKYNQFLYNNDIALVELGTPLVFSRNVSAVCLPKRQIQPRQICVTVGWGFPMNGEVDLQQYLKFLPVPTYDSEKCNASSHYAGFITKDNICAGFTDNDKGPCYNDEGAPLMCVSETGGSARWEIQGLLSHHSRCSRGHPAIYSSVEPALSWLRQSVPALQKHS